MENSTTSYEKTSVSPEVSLTAVWFLLSIGIITVILIVFYMYFTKKLCFKSCNGCDGILEPEYDSTKKSLARSYDESDSDSSCDSDEETFRNMQRAIQRSNTSLRASISAEPDTSRHEQDEFTDLPLEQDMNQKRLKKDLKTAGDDSPTTMIPHGKTSEGFDWSAEGESIYSKEISSSFMEEDEFGIREKAGNTSDQNKDWNEYQPISSCGTLDIALNYLFSDKKLQITILEAKDLPSKDRGGASVVQVHVVVLPAKRKRYKTKVQHIESSYFGETFKLSHVSPESLRGLGLRIRLYGIGKVRDRLIGEATIRLDELNLMSDPQLTVTLQLEPRTDVNRSDLDPTLAPSLADIGPTASTLAHGGSLPEILLSLSYNELTGRLMVEVVKGSHFRNLAAAKPPDTFVKLVLLNSSCQEMAQSKTSIRRSQPNPFYKQTFYFQVALFQLSEVSLMVNVYCHNTIKRKSLLGWLTMGRNSSSDMDRQHWQEMKEAQGKPVTRWHTLVEP